MRRALLLAVLVSGCFATSPDYYSPRPEVAAFQQAQAFHQQQAMARERAALEEDKQEEAACNTEMPNVDAWSACMYRAIAMRTLRREQRAREAEMQRQADDAAFDRLWNAKVARENQKWEAIRAASDAAKNSGPRNCSGYVNGAWVNVTCY